MSRPLVRRLGRVDCAETIAAMRTFTMARVAGTPDEIWLCEHPPVYTLGIAGRTAHVRDPGGIPVLSTDRGGQVTYHGPGQVVAYPLVDLRRLGLHVKAYVYRLEQAALRTLEAVGVTGHRVTGAPGDIPVVPTDRGGQVTYHGPGQAVAYVLLDLRRSGIGVKELVRRLEGALIDVLETYGITGERRAGMPGVYVRGAKIAAIGLRVSRGCTYHGVALNSDLDLAPFGRIDPCGYPGLAATSLAALGASDKIDAVQQRLGDEIAAAVAPA